MPRFRTHDIPHTAGSDHRILRRPLPNPTESFDDGRLMPMVFDQAQRRVPPDEIKRATGLALVEQQVVFSDREMLLSALRMMMPVQSQEIPDAAAILEAIGEDVVVLKQVGSVFQLFNDPIRANACWERTLQLSPHDDDARFWLVKNSLQQGALEDAITHLRFLLAINPGDYQVYELKSQLLDLTGNLPGAISAAEKSTELDPGQVTARKWLLDAYRRSGQEDKRKEQLDMLRRINEALQES
jgi:tetratricopeptide (TPR) repeat protein